LTAGCLSAAHPRSQLTVEAIGLLMAGAASVMTGAAQECANA